MQHDLTLRHGPYSLHPLTPDDIAPLVALAAQAPHEYTHLSGDPATDAYYTGILYAPDQMGFVKRVDGQLAGCTRYMELRPAHRRVEVGGTWIAPAFMRTGANRAFKRLLLAHAFGEMGMHRVEIKTDILNTRSQTAIAALGAQREGVLRRHMVRRDGSVRDTVLFSVTDEDWPAVQARLDAPRP
ncbi:GNAT family N-acetyltransferase [Deinococcus aquiradiocola]|uniref:N-acetyltransferase n=1 Tax=Deinococcus aquiradiocola TaxID=393059 RepID=A0A917UPM8_9DEIO|nr:GNAT family protein [Deinococcus aquiradiocola]GGJ72640.1 N-acetyltransferase [Deinococcus aquiradiocola]